MTSYQRRCDVITSHRRWYDVILTLCAQWDHQYRSFCKISTISFYTVIYIHHRLGYKWLKHCRWAKNFQLYISLISMKHYRAFFLPFFCSSSLLFSSGCSLRLFCSTCIDKNILFLSEPEREITYIMTHAHSEDSDQPAHLRSQISLRCSPEEFSDPWQSTSRQAKTLIRLRGCAGWSESLLCARVIRYIISRFSSHNIPVI